MSTARRRVAFTSCALLAVCLSVAGQQKQERSENEIRIPPAKQNLPAEQVFKKIEILKGKAAARLPELMKALNRSLGVDCAYCHVLGNTEEKRIKTGSGASAVWEVSEACTADMTAAPVPKEGDYDEE